MTVHYVCTSWYRGMHFLTHALKPSIITEELLASVDVLNVRHQYKSETDVENHLILIKRVLICGLITCQS